MPTMGTHARCTLLQQAAVQSGQMYVSSLLRLEPRHPAMRKCAAAAAAAAAEEHVCAETTPHRASIELISLLTHYCAFGNCLELTGDPQRICHQCQHSHGVWTCMSDSSGAIIDGTVANVLSSFLHGHLSDLGQHCVPLRQLKDVFAVPPDRVVELHTASRPHNATALSCACRPGAFVAILTSSTHGSGLANEHAL